MNRMLTKAIDGMTPYEAAFAQKPDLRDVHEWGEKVWVCTETGNKLGGCIREGRWLGLDERSKGVCTYWPDTETVSIEWNVYINKTSVSCFEGEKNEGIVKMDPNIPSTPVNPQNPSSHTQPLNSSQNPAPDTTIPSNDPITNESSSKLETWPKHIWKPTQHVKDILEGAAKSSNLPKS